MNRVLGTALLTAAVAVALPAAAGPAAASRSGRSNVRLAPGVMLIHTTFTMVAGTRHLLERVTTVEVALGRHTTLVAASPKSQIGAPRVTVLALARQERAVAGINGDFFYLADPTAVPRGGVSHRGQLLKSALVAKQAALYVTSAGIAAIGDPGFAGTVRTGDGHSYRVRSMNSLENAENGGLTLTDPNLLSDRLPDCTVARLGATAAAGRYTVRSVSTMVTRYTRAAVGTRALVTCGRGRTWVQANLVPGHPVSVSAGYRVPHINTLLSGGRVLIRAGKRYHDKVGLLGYGNQRKPETFGCVKRDGRHVLIGAIDGDAPGAAGMTYAEETSYLLQQHCWSALTYDGSGSSTVVAKRPGHRLAVENHPTNKSGPRKVVDGLFVVAS